MTMLSLGCGRAALPDDGTHSVSPPPPPGAEVGTADPILVVALSAERRWAVVCQAREDTDGDGVVDASFAHHGGTYGDRLQPYLVLGGGPGRPIDDYVASDRRGRFLAVIDGGALVLIDAARGHAEPLAGADTEGGDPTYGPHRAAAFSPDGASVVYVRRASLLRHEQVVVRSLASGEESVMVSPPGVLVRATFDDASALVLETVESDTDGNGRLEAPRGRGTLDARRCRGPARSWSTSRPTGDATVRRRVEGDRVGAPLAPTEGRETLPATTIRLSGGVERSSEGQHEDRRLPLGPLRFD